MKKFCKEFGINIEEEITEYDVNKLVKWMMIQNNEIDCEYLLNMWNIITDFATSIGEDFDIDDTEVHHIYNKLFYGNNLSSINTSEKQYNPIFNEHEQNLLINVFTKGVSILEKEFNLKL